MKKKVLLTVAAAMAVTSVAFASPLTNYEKGSTAIDISSSISPKFEISAGGISGTDDSKERLGAGVTYGLGDKFALQYKYLDNKSNTYFLEVTEPGSYERSTDEFQLTGHQLNLLYQLNPNVSAFVGWTRGTAKDKWTYKAGPDAGDIVERTSGTESQSKSGYQVGFVGQTKLADNLTGWASISAGNKVNAYEIGIGYDVAQNTELNVFYRQIKYKDFSFGDVDFDVTTKGLGAGVTFKF
ncbi:outer membrane beta-barrel protein [Anaerospora hongkongensis]|uniref:outer membrane beta-barrel protein n=1 Tax=Anaerospora hongkongensis TaxID=244830 RepID=UPI00289D4DB8|nr:outer membrane beta-barrel protein [Anaerospora hongkongensis]